MIAPCGELRIYPNADPVGARKGLDGAGILAYQTGEQLHPPMVDDEALWADARRWPEAAVRHVLEALEFCDLPPKPRILDIGCGVGGPARLLVDSCGATVYGVATYPLMLHTARVLNEAEPRWRERITVVQHDCQEPYRAGDFDLAWSMNMAYQVCRHDLLLSNVCDALSPGGRLMIEDWMLWPTATAETLAELEHHFGSQHFLHISTFIPQIVAAGLDIERTQNLGFIGATLMARHFRDQFDRWIRPELERDFPAPPMSGAAMADAWVEAVEATSRMYQSGELGYVRVLARKPR